ncbi:hypothetical protein AVEN_224665-1, partial [Araneus ventricosus]
KQQKRWGEKPSQDEAGYYSHPFCSGGRQVNPKSSSFVISTPTISHKDRYVIRAAHTGSAHLYYLIELHVCRLISSSSGLKGRSGVEGLCPGALPGYRKTVSRDDELGRKSNQQILLPVFRISAIYEQNGAVYYCDAAAVIAALEIVK